MSTITYSRRDIQRILKNNGWNFTRQTGSHRIYTNDHGDHITVTCRTSNKMIIQRLIKEYNLQIDL